MEIVVTGRNVEVPDHFRGLVEEKLSRLERHDHKIVGMEVVLFHEPNRRQQKSCQRVEITGRGGCGAVARAEASGPDFYAALDLAAGKLAERLRRSHDRRKPSRRDRVQASRAAATASAVALMEQAPPISDTIPAPRAHDETLPDAEIARLEEQWDAEYRPGRIVREKTHGAAPMTVDEALSRMELVGHDFYLFSCSESGRPSVVYRRHGYDYGVIRLGV
ncbi:30S ribosomal protein S30 [Pseudonocardia sp. EC080610-09]|uniref:ribosome hibernation-promoting factor, HPF/YfiA family n=1 Tax=unclassified Pseudonocardia TaxID=2619320 RepID=UPI0006CB02AF|nr:MULTISPECIES: ribosome-associated translation inhibitor RaiA [unclassified Pseudonocardia]ALE72329.1 30S ribosomal protein S30 [Pseudonocardia sp. EC080625-04]ALL75621.1 30S ribosomal protein S30 [Pseudonocardia sp. EC080610-09]ALL82650.1 30S ribosomal protein S30 [Pseudonocardia sp. EC080619-01]